MSHIVANVASMCGHSGEFITICVHLAERPSLAWDPCPKRARFHPPGFESDVYSCVCCSADRESLEFENWTVLCLDCARGLLDRHHPDRPRPDLPGPDYRRGGPILFVASSPDN
jgi:hypothetical protein